MKSVIAPAVMLLLQCACAAANVSEPVSVTLAPAGDRIWHVTFETSGPTNQIKLARTPDDSRLHRWKILEEKYSLEHDGDADWIRRRDGSSFSRVTIAVPATYIPLPKEYAPFSPFQDGGLLMFSGRYHACSGECPDESPGTEGPWNVTLALPTGSRAIVDGVVHDEPVTWVDVDDGTKIYVGPGEPIETGDFVAVIDRSLPKHIGDYLVTLLPTLMDFYGQRLVAPVRRPMLFASYDPGYESGSGHQGGTLPDQVFMHFYGPGWDRFQKDNQPMIAFFFAHEAAHLFQARDSIRPRDEIAWIHEGGADAFAFLALTRLQSISKDYAESRKTDAFDKCVSGLSMQPLNEAAAAGHYQDHYACGLLMHLAVDGAVRTASNGQRDLFDFWRSFLATVETQSDWTQEKFLSALRNEGAEDTAEFLFLLANVHQRSAETFLRQGLADAGLLGNW